MKSTRIQNLYLIFMSLSCVTASAYVALPSAANVGLRIIYGVRVSCGTEASSHLFCLLKISAPRRNLLASGTVV